MASDETRKFIYCVHRYYFWLCLSLLLLLSVHHQITFSSLSSRFHFWEIWMVYQITVNHVRFYFSSFLDFISYFYRRMLIYQFNSRSTRYVWIDHDEWYWFKSLIRQPCIFVFFDYFFWAKEDIACLSNVLIMWCMYRKEDRD